MKLKRLTALLATLLVGTATCGVFSGCGTKVEDDYDPTKANLSVATFDGGVGRKWLEEAAKRFMELHKDSKHFQEGRTGVKISVSGNKDSYTGNQLAEKSMDKDMYFTENVNYYTIVNQGKVANITDVIQADMSDYGETGTIEDKIDDAFKSFLTAKDGNYYMVPFYDGFYGFIYDVDLFETEGFYVDDDGDYLKLPKNANDAQRKTFEENKANGPDGEDGTYDDGLPATYADFIALCDYMVSKSVVPFCYSGQHVGYVNRSFRPVMADYEGYDAFRVNYTLEGKDVEVVKSIKADGSVELETVDINVNNGYEVQRQAGKYYALWLQEKLFGTTKYIGESWNSLDYTIAQQEFIMGKYTAKPYAMLMEGVWWENEADKTFSDIEALRGESKNDRRFGLLPIPKVSADKAGPQTMFAGNSSFGMINVNCENMELAKEFMRFLHTDAEMSKFSASTSIPRSLNYEVSPADRAKATHFGKTIIDMRSQAKVVYPYSSQDLVINNPSTFDQENFFTYADLNGKGLNNPFNAFKNDTATVKQYFDGLYIYQKGMWHTLVK